MEDVSVDGMIILKCIFRKQVGGVDWVNLARDRDMVGLCDHGDVSSVSVKFGKFLD
jgi:hypothetical protein